jgi:peptidoglycan/xylan/chitin deacetylase (PgdA/CDA1 family)
MMRFVVIIVAALMILGLAAFGVVSAQKMAAVPGSPAAPNTRVASLVSGAPAAPRAPVSQPVSQIAQAGSSEASSSAPRAAAEPAPAWPAAHIAHTTPSQTAAAPSTPAANSSAQSKSAPAATNIPPCDKPGGMGLARVVEIDTTGGPGFGFEHFKQYDFLREKEVVLTFDDGPWPQNTPAVLKALADECLKATFFEIGEHATWHPEITKQVIEAGMTVGTHTWSHKDLARNPYASDIEKAKQEIEMGFSAVHMAAAVLVAPFFRFPDLQHPPQLLAYLPERNIASFSTDIDSFDFKIRKGEQVVKSVMTKLEKRGKGIILMHDFQHSTAEGLPELIRQLKAGGYSVVHMVPRQPLSTLAKYDDMVTQLDKLSSNNTRPASSVVHTIAQ